MLGYLIPDIWYNCSHKLPGEERGLETQLKFSISFEMKKIIAHDCFTDHTGKNNNNLTLHLTHSFPLITFGALEP